MPESRPAAAIGPAEYRSILAQRHREGGSEDAERADNAELVFNLFRLHGRLFRDFEGLHRRSGRSWAGFRVMNVLWALGPVELRDLARLSGVSKAAISSAVTTLERDGLVRRVRVREDGRLVRVGLTDRGHATLDDAVRTQAAREHAWFARLRPAERQHLADLLGRLADQDQP